MEELAKIWILNGEGEDLNGVDGVDGVVGVCLAIVVVMDSFNF